MIRRFFPELQQMIRAIDQDLSSSLGRWPFLQTSVGRSPAAPSTETEFFHPISDVHETERSYLIETEVPGVRKDDLNMEITDGNTLLIKGRVEKALQLPAKEKRHSTIWAAERMVGEFRRAFTFPSKIDPEKLKATLKNGVLTVELPKTEAGTDKISIEIKEE